MCPNNALIGGDNCGAGRKRGGALFQSVGHQDKRRGGGGGGREAPRFLVRGRGTDLQRGHTPLGALVGLSKLKIQMKEKRIVMGKK